MRNVKQGLAKPAAVAALAALAWAGPALADVRDGVDAWSRGDFKAAVKEWRAPAAKGDADAQFNLGQAYKLGRGVSQDLSQAEKLFTQAAAKGHLQAADNLGLLLFQLGQRDRAIPFIRAASSRGDPRAHYVLGLTHFNGDGVEKDWERAYALVSLAQQAGLPQAAGALAKMDEYIPLDQRQRAVAKSAVIASQAEAQRRNQVAAADLGVTGAGPVSRSSGSIKPFDPASASPGASTPGADYTLGRVPPVAGIMNSAKPPPAPSIPRANPAPHVATAIPAARQPVAAAPVKPRPQAAGPWRVQLGAFGVAGNADRLWSRVQSRPELAGHSKLKVPAGRVTKLQAGGFASQKGAQSACSALKASGFECIVVRK